MKGWKISFFVSLTVTLLTIVSAAYIVLANTLTSSHCHENESIIRIDVENISAAIRQGAHSLNDFHKELEKIGINHTIEENSIRLELVVLTFDKDGKFNEIQL